MQVIKNYIDGLTVNRADNNNKTRSSTYLEIDKLVPDMKNYLCS